MAAISYEPAPIEIDQYKDKQGTIPTAEARSSLLRDLEVNLAVRNSREVVELPDEVSRDLDELFCFIEESRLDEMEENAHRYLRKQHIKKSVGLVAVAGETGDWEQLPVSGRLDSAVLVAAVSSLALERFKTVECKHIHNLNEVDVSYGLSEEPIERSRGLMRVVASAIEDIDIHGLTLSQSEAAKALGVSTKSNRRALYVI